MDTKKPLKLRAHHGMCLQFFQGNGYSDAFTAHMKEIHDRLWTHPEQEILLCAEIDDVCSACPNRVERHSEAGKGMAQTPCNQDGWNVSCASQEKVSRYDAEVLKACDLLAANDGEYAIAWEAFSSLVAKRIINTGLRHEICGDCEWDALCWDKEDENISPI